MVPNLTRSLLHRVFQRHGLGRLPTIEDAPARRRFRAYRLGYMYIDPAEVSIH